MLSISVNMFTNNVQQKPSDPVVTLCRVSALLMANSLYNTMQQEVIF